ncbi:MAG: response regulator [Gammaproteobacteria bacterium]|nr:response regulator [Gammaproteobacteria bacterium]
MVELQKIAIVDDEEDIREMLEEYLTGQGFECLGAADAVAARQLLREWHPSMVLLDIKMPGEDGLSLARYIREHHEDVAIIMLTAAGEVVSRIAGLETGADDYLAKPCDLRELLARIKSVLRRSARRAELEAATTSGDVSAVAGRRRGERIRFGRCVLDVDSHSLTAEDGELIALTSMEFDLLKAFAEHPNRVLSRDQLLDMAHNRSSEPFDRSIDIRISRLRRKIEQDPSKPQVIKTMRGAGYMFVSDG